MPPGNEAGGISDAGALAEATETVRPPDAQSKLICTFIILERSPAISKASTAWAMG